MMFPISLISLVASFIPLLGIASAQCKGLNEWPQVTLPWGTVTASDCDPDVGVWIFRNVRFGKATNGLSNGTPRFAQSTFPDSVSNPGEVHLDTSTSTVCLGINPKNGPSCSSGDGSEETPPAAGPILSPPNDTNDNGSEDCLFLDIFVPWSFFSNSSSLLPVVVWFYGGAYLFGSKDQGLGAGLPLYDGRGFFEAAQQMQTNNLIYVAGNYRLAHLGWLSGPTVLGVNDPTKAMPNAGLGDQRLLLQFVQKNIELFGGNSSEVTVFGESAGAGSILHHLVAQDGGEPRDPLFERAMMQSAAFQWIWDNSDGGVTDTTFKNFVSYTNSCTNETGSAALSCLQGIGTDEISAALATFWTDAKCSGVWNIGPAVDGTVIPQLPAITLENEFKFHSRVQAIISSHVEDEAQSFVPKYVTSNSGFGHLLESFLPGDAPPRPSQRTAISNIYCSNSDCTNQKHAARQMIQDSMFTCNVRYMFDAAQQTPLPIYILDYAFYHNYLDLFDLARHATDLLPTFWTKNDTVANPDAVASAVCQYTGIPRCSSFVKNKYLPKMENLRNQYQKYLMAFALNGDPNQSQQDPVWPTATAGDTLGNVLTVRDPLFSGDFSVGPDLVSMQHCSFWSCMATAVTNGLDGSECSSSSFMNDLVFQEL